MTGEHEDARRARAKAEDRKRLAAALRANLKRRKAAGAPGHGPGEVPGGAAPGGAAPDDASDEGSAVTDKE